MRKIDRKYTNPFDNLLVDLTNKIDFIFFKLGFTPNILTTFNLIFSLLSLQSLYHKGYFLSITSFLIAYYFDCADGSYARKYKMISKYGDLYDHILDLFKITTFFTIIVAKLIINSRYVVLSILLFNCLGTFVFNGYQEKLSNYKKKSIESPTLKFTQLACTTNDIKKVKRRLKFLRFLGDGTLFLNFAILLAMV